MTCLCGHDEREHTDRMGRCHADDDTCGCLAYVLAGLALVTQEDQKC